MIGSTSVEASHRCPKHCISPNIGFIRSSIKFKHDFVDDTLLVHRETNKGFFEAFPHVKHCLFYALPHVPTCVSIP